MTKPNFPKLMKDAKATLTKHSPEILMGVGIAGMITTTVLAVRATPKALQLIEQAKKEKRVDKLTAIDTIKVAWKPYIPATITGVGSIACLIGSNAVSLKRTTALTAAYKLSETALAEYKDAVIETVGEKKEQTVREKVNQKQIEKHVATKNDVRTTGRGETLCLDPLSGRWFKHDIEKIRKAENSLNKRMLHDICGTVSLNEFYDELGLDRVEVGDDLGWNTEHLINLDITPGMDDGENPCLVIGHYNAPKWGY